MTDSEIVALYFRRDEQAISESDLKYGKRLRALSARIVDDFTAEECVNDTYVKSWQQIPPKNPENYLFAFFAKITRNLSLDRYRRSARQKRTEDLTLFIGELNECIPDGETPSDMLMAGELSALIEEYLRTKKQEARGIFIYRYFYLYDLKSTAVHFGVSCGKVKSTLFRMRTELREFLRKAGYVK